MKFLRCHTCDDLLYITCPIIASTLPGRILPYLRSCPRRKLFKEQAKTKAAVRDEFDQAQMAQQNGRRKGPDSLSAASRRDRTLLFMKDTASFEHLKVLFYSRCILKAVLCIERQQLGRGLESAHDTGRSDEADACYLCVFLP